ncbi:hypothetical protein [Streptomyces endophyticus]|uniref:Asp23/Gls24 family envelope stress response protein n=1 Tax=Streptomyces endophyticus TaxID=714166 RepID=A0ABU6F0P3_9ACTN|nr:hypothetical protein [Streptomyces endophyticus]MEB8337570.1 hypothetical protein [Streptomyces endophyticus]
MTRTSIPDQLTDAIARAVADVPGVAFLKPDLAGRLRSALAHPVPPAGAGPSGVRLTPPRGADDPWHIEIQLVALAHSRTVDVARAARRAAEEHLAMAVSDQGTRAHVTVTVTGLI